MIEAPLDQKPISSGPARVTKIKKPQSLRAHRNASLPTKSHESPEDLFKVMFEHIGDEVMLIDGEGCICYVNGATCRGMKYPQSYLLRHKVTDFFSDQMSVAQWKQTHLRAIKKKGGPSKIAVSRLIKGGSREFIEITANYFEHKGKAYVLSIARDITQRLLLEESLRQSETLYRLLSEGAQDGIITVDLKGDIIYANKALVDMVKVPFEKSRGKPFLNYVHQDSRKVAVASFQKALKKEEQISAEIEILDKKRALIPVEINVAPLFRDEKIFAVHAIVRDIRARKQCEDMARLSDKMEALKLFVTGTAQELKHPLNAISEKIEAVVSAYGSRDFEYLGYKDYDHLMSVLGEISKQIKYCYHITGNLIELSRKKAGLKRGPSNANAIIREHIRMLDDELKAAGVRVRLVLKENLPLITMGEIEFANVLSNLINNSLQAMTSEGRLTIRTMYISKNRRVKIAIQDNGVGISQDNLKRVFEPFFTTKQRGVQRNSGLGLPIVYAMVKGVQGDISIESSQRAGTTVTMWLPVV